MGATFHRVGRWNYAVVAAVLLAVMVLPLFRGHALAYGQVTSRSIEMSSSIINASGVSYTVSFTPATTATVIKSIAVDFCSNDPLIGDSCTAPTSFSVGTPTVTTITTPGETGATWTPTAANTNRTLLLTNSGTITGTPTPATAWSFILTTAHNPNTSGTFYARIFTFANNGDAATWAAASAGNGSSTTLVTDAGGIALSIVTTINITARVQEQLTFCTSSTAITGICSGGVATPNITIGHDNGSGTIILDNTAVDASLAYTQLSTNAGSGVIVRMKSSNTCSGTSNNGGMSSSGGTNCSIAGVSAGAGTVAVIAAGLPGGNPGGAFGMCVNKGSNTTVATTYNDTSANHCPITGSNPWNALTTYGMDGSTTAGVASTYGSQIFSTASAVSAEANTLEFAATASTTTPAGVYTANENLIATGTF